MPPTRTCEVVLGALHFSLLVCGCVIVSVTAGMDSGNLLLWLNQEHHTEKKCFKSSHLPKSISHLLYQVTSVSVMWASTS